MQAVNDQQHDATVTRQSAVISAEMLAYLVLIIFAAVLRFASLGDVMMTDVEAVQALPAYHAVNDAAPGTPAAPTSAVVFWLQRLSFTFFGGSDFAARLPGVLGGIILVMLPLLFRGRLGTERTFLMSLVLAVSPVAFTAARLSDSAIWTALFTLVMLWAFWNYWDLPVRERALVLAATLAAMVFLSGSAGLPFLLVLLLAGVVTVAWMIYAAPDERDSPGDEILDHIAGYWRNLPVLPVTLMLLATVLVLGTGFLFDLSGLNIVASAVGTAVAGLFTPATIDAPFAHGLLSLLVYEPLLVILGLMSAATLVTGSIRTPLDRFMIAWAAIGMVFLLVYRGSTPAMALMVVLPLAYLTATLVREMLVNYMPSFLSLDSYYSDDPDDYVWIKALVAIIVFAGFVMLGLYLSTLGRTLLNYPGTTIALNTDQQSIMLYARFAWIAIMGILLVVLYFLLASLWGNRNVVQGYILGIFAFMLMMGIGTGWNTAVVQVSNPAELWHTTAVTPDAYELRETLFEVARRDTRGFPAIDVTILRDEAAGMRDDGLIAWLVRDFENARFVDSIASTRQQEIILLAAADNEEPDLGGSYVGQSFAIRENWQDRRLLPIDWISWFTHRNTRDYALPQDVAILWLRIDVYDGVPAIERP